MYNTLEPYERGMKHLDKGEWQDAIDCFIETLRQDATHTEAIAKLQWVQKQQKLEDLYTQGEQHLAAKNWPGAIEAFSEVVNLDRSYKDARSKLKQAKQFRDLGALYEKGLGYLREEKWQKAINALERVQKADVGYDVSAQLEEARKRKRLEELYEEGIAHMRKEEWAKALGKLDEAYRLDPNHKDVGTKREEASEQKEQQVNLAELYGKAKGYERTQEWEEARKTYLEILKIDSTYEDVPKRVEKVGREIKLQDSGVPRRSFLAWWLRLSTEARIGLLGILITALVTICAALVASPLIIELIAGRFLTPTTSTPTATFTPTLTKTVTPTVVSSPTHTPTITPTSTPSPTAMPTNTRYPAPALVSPDEGTSFPEGQDVKLVWEWERDLAEDEFFEVRIRLKGEQEFDQMDLIKVSYQFVPASELTQAGTYEWQVAIVSLSGEEKSVSQIWSFVVR